MKNKEIPTIEIQHSWYWDCPDCGETNETEFNGEGFDLPLRCDECGKEFNDYNYDKN